MEKPERSAPAAAIEFAFAIDDLPASAEFESLLRGGALVANPHLCAALERLPLARDGDEVGANVEDQMVSALGIARPGDELAFVSPEVLVACFQLLARDLLDLLEGERTSIALLRPEAHLRRRLR